MSIVFDVKKMISFPGLKYTAAKQEYERSNRLVDKWCKIAYVVIEKIFIPSVILPKAIFCFFVYFSTDLGNKAFDLPIPIW